MTMDAINEFAAKWEASHGFCGVPASHAATDEDESDCTLHQAVACVLLKRLNRGG